MAVETVEIGEFLEKRPSHPVIDVRAPIEFNKAAMIGAKNVPLFDDEQRARVGTTYKQQGREKAIRLGLKIAGPRMQELVEQVDQLRFGPSANEEGSKQPDHVSREVLVYCARGGMRSESVSWLLDQADYKVTRLAGGYKSYRQLTHQTFEKSWNIMALTGMTGSGKTRLLHELAEAGEQVIDLEGLACHRGSAFGGIGQREQPSTECFENQIFEKLITLNPQKRIWVEDESRSVGKCVVPQPFFEQLHSAPALYIEISHEERLDFLVQEYGDLPVDDMVAAINRIAKRLGGQNVNAAVQSLQDNEIRRCAEILLAYYDKTYGVCREKNPRHDVQQLDLTGCNSEQRLSKVLAAVS